MESKLSQYLNRYSKEGCLALVLLFVAFWTILFSRNTEASGFLQSLIESRFLSLRNLENLSRQVGMYGIFSLGMGLVIISGGIDLSVGSLMALFGTVFFFLLTGSHSWIPGMPWVPAIIVLLAFSTIVGVFHGWLIAKIRMPAFVVTLCGLLGYRGLAQTMTHDTAIGYYDAKFGIAGLEKLLTGEILGLPAAFIAFLFVSSVVYYLLHLSVFGRYLLALGRNEQAASYSGINTKLIMGLAYVSCSILAAISALFFAVYTADVVPSIHGNFYELYAIAGAVLGGCSLRGGEGTVIGIILGTTVLLVLQNMVNLLGYDSSFSKVITALVILGGVLVDRFEIWKLVTRTRSNTA
ncbi:MAG: ABC transporter permease [Verrucomicrobiota bacterium]|nr:ABC transporter permease [Verrucomicrobiota bacterium]